MATRGFKDSFCRMKAPASTESTRPTSYTLAWRFNVFTECAWWSLVQNRACRALVTVT